MVAGGKLRDDPPVGLVHGDLGVDRLGQEAPVIKGHPSLVARGLDAED